MCWIEALNIGDKIGIYCSDVSGAFDRVPASRLIGKLASFGVDKRVLAVVQSWLRPRRAYVVVAGSNAREMKLSDMVFQGTVWGPGLWNTYFGDSQLALHTLGFSVVVYADDLNCFRRYKSHLSNEIILEELREAQVALHKWGAANQIVFDAGKEEYMVMARTGGEGDAMKLLGVKFDNRLSMSLAVDDCVKEVAWKVRALLRTSRYHTDAEMLTLFKSHIWSYIEYRTPAFFHATSTTLQALDGVLPSFLSKCNVSECEALLNFNLAPLHARRDMAMLGFHSPYSSGQGPAQFRRFSVRDHASARESGRHFKYRARRLVDTRGKGRDLDMFRRSVFGMVRVYNLLLDEIVMKDIVKSFLATLQGLLEDRAGTEAPSWQFLFSCRRDSVSHPLCRC